MEKDIARQVADKARDYRGNVVAKEKWAKEFFQSPEYLTWLQMLANGVVGRNVPVNANYGPIPMNGKPLNTACTDGKQVWINTRSSVIWTFADLTNRFSASVGMLMHECAHILFSDFDTENKLVREFQNGAFPACAPTPDNGQEALYLSEMEAALQNAGYARLLRELFLQFSNIVADPHDEDRLIAVRSKMVEDSIICVRESLLSSAIPLDKIDEPFNVIMSGALMMARFGELLVYGRENLPADKQALLAFIEESLSRPLSDARDTDDPVKKAVALNKVLLKLWPHIKKEVGQRQQNEPQQGTSQQGETQQGASQQGASQQGETQQGASQQGETRQGESQQGETQQGESQQGESQQGETQQGASQQGASQQGKPQQGASQQGASQQGKPQQGASQQGASQQGKPQQGASQQGASQQGKPQQGASQQGASQQGKPQQGASQQGKPQQGASQQGASQQGKPQQGASQQGASQQGKPQQGASQQGKPQQGASQQGASQQGSSQGSASQIESDMADEGSWIPEPEDSISSAINDIIADIKKDAEQSGATVTPEGAKSSDTAKNSSKQDGATAEMDNSGPEEDQNSEMKDVLDALLGQMAKRMAEEAVEGEIDQMVRDQIRSVSQNSTHRGVKINPVSMANVTSDDVRKYEELYAKLRPYAKRSAEKMRMILRDIVDGNVQHRRHTGNQFEACEAYRPDERYWAKKTAPKDLPEMAIALLVDQSGSMNGSRIDSAMKAAILLYDLAGNLDIPIAVMGHNTGRRWNTGHCVDIYLYTDFKKVSGKERYRLAKMESGGRNRDGAAIEVAANMLSKRTEDIKLLFVISDGLPNDSGYSGTAAEQDISNIIRKYRKMGIETIAAAIGDDRAQIKSIYGEGSFLDISNLDKFPKILTELVKKKLMDLIS